MDWRAGGVSAGEYPSAKADGRAWGAGIGDQCGGVRVFLGVRGVAGGDYFEWNREHSGAGETGGANLHCSIRSINSVGLHSSWRLRAHFVAPFAVRPRRS